ncbi:MAG: DUF721 domain-containing protein, partial [Symploca sp. SIO2B6]|nr:DUF721 domain-containing protein [Symploca sp. SIO2B6]
MTDTHNMQGAWGINYLHIPFIWGYTEENKKHQNHHYGLPEIVTFSSLEQLVGHLESRPQWRSHQQFQQILDCWPKVVGPIVAAQTCPLSIQRHVLRVSTSSAVWAQNLAFQRPHILKKLTSYMPEHSLKDIRFSPAKWTDLHKAGSKQQGGRSLKQYH